jgi:hypothetical protein
MIKYSSTHGVIMDVLGEMKIPKKPTKTKKCPRCEGTDIMVISGSPTFYFCHNDKCPSREIGNPNDNDHKATKTDPSN